MGYNAHFIDSLLPKKLVNLEDKRIGHKVSRETNEIYRLFHDIEKHNVKEPEQRLIGELSRLIASKWGLNGNLGYKIPYPHIPKGLTHKYRKIVVNLNEPGSPGETIEEPHIPISNHLQSHIGGGKNQHVNDGLKDSFHHHQHHMPIYHNHHLSNKRDSLHHSYANVVNKNDSDTETAAKRQLKQLRHENRTVASKTKTGAKRNLQKPRHSKNNQLHRSLLAKTTPIWQRVIPESAFPHKADYLHFIKSLKDDWNRLGSQLMLMRHARRRRKSNTSAMKKKNFLFEKKQGTHYHY